MNVVFNEFKELVLIRSDQYGIRGVGIVVVLPDSFFLSSAKPVTKPGLTLSAFSPETG